MTTRQATLVLFGGALGLMLAVMLCARVIIGHDYPTPGRRALAHWLPIAAAAATFAWMGRVELAMGIIFGTSVAALTSVSGFVSLTAPAGEPGETYRPVWLLLPAATLLAYFVGFRGSLSTADALALLAQGAVIWWLWRAQRRTAPAGISPAPRPSLWGLGRLLTMIELAVICALAMVAATAAGVGGFRLSQVSLLYPLGTIAATLLSIALAMPMISSGTHLAASGDTRSAMTGHIGVVFLNLCAALPMVFILSSIRAWSQWWAAGDRQLASLKTMPLWTHTIAYPLAIWRIDAVALVILSLLVVAVALGKLRIERRLAAGLIAGYCIYLLLAMLAGLMRI